MHIGFITADLHHHHGWGHYSLAVIDALRAAGLQVTVVAAHNSPTDLPYPVYPVLPALSPAEHNQLLKMTACTRQVRALLASCDLIHCAVEPYAPLAMWAAAGRPYVITGHGTYARAGWNRHPLVRQLHKAAFRAAARVICVSHYTRRVVQDYVPGAQAVTVTSAIHPERFDHLPPLPTPPSRPTILTAGGIKRRKGTPQLIEAVVQVRQALPEVQCVVLGSTTSEPATTAEVEALIDTHDLGDHVQLLGFVSEETLLGWYGAADVFALPSINDGYKFEGFGLVHLEASAAGLPVVGADNCGAEDAVWHQKTGLLVRQDNLSEELPAALLWLLQHPDEAAQMGAAGAARTRQETWAVKIQEIIATYRAVLDE